MKTFIIKWWQLEEGNDNPFGYYNSKEVSWLIWCRFYVC